MSDRGVTTLRKHEDFYLRDGNVYFLVENTMFCLHKYFFERESDYFRRRFQSSSEPDDGSVDEPYSIPDVKADEFAHFVWVWYNPRYSFSKQDKQKWLTILKLATMWGFYDMKQLAVRQLEKMKLDPVQKITIYRQYSIENELLLSSYVMLCRSPKLPSPEEGEKLTMETILKLASAREQVVRRASELGCQTPSTAGAPDDLVEAIVAKSFDLNLHLYIDNLGARPPATDVVTVKQPDPSKKQKPNAEPQASAQNGDNANATPKGKKRAALPYNFS